MLIDNEKFVGLLVENSGIEKEKVEKYLEELINDIKSSFDEGEGYELEGFGIFSKLGANVLFIPSEELETEINYKYVGMEPIELPSGVSGNVKEEEDEEQEENPLQEILDGETEDKPDEYEDPFAELIGDDDQDIEAAVQEEIENEEQEEVLEETKEEEEIVDLKPSDSDDMIPESEALEDSLKDIFGVDDEQVSETEAVEEEKETPGPDKWGIDAHKEDDQEDAFSGLMGDAASKDEELIEEDIIAPDEVSEEVSEEKEEIDFAALENDNSSEDFDDPFRDFEDEDEQEEDFVPVVTNVASEKTSKDEEDKDKTLEEGLEKKEKKNKPKSSKKRNQRAPVFLYLVLALIILAGSGYLLAYFGVVNIQGITPKSNTQVALINPPSTPEEVTPESTVPEQTEDNGVSPTNDANQEQIEQGNVKPDDSNAKSEEPEETKSDLAPIVVDEKSPDINGIITPVNIQSGAEAYGLLGTATEAGNNGYTIVLYTLSKKSGADRQFEKLSKDGYRVIIKEKPSNTYGVLYRVSIGQFKSLADAAVAAERVDQEILGNYIITKI